MSFSPYIGFDGNARTAMTHYAGIFGAEDLQIMNFSDIPADQRPPRTDTLNDLGYFRHHLRTTT